MRNVVQHNEIGYVGAGGVSLLGTREWNLVFKLGFHPIDLESIGARGKRSPVAE